MKTTTLVVDLDDEGYMLLSTIKELVPSKSEYYYDDKLLFEYNKLVDRIKVELTTQSIFEIMSEESNYMINLLNLPDWRYFEDIEELKEIETKNTLASVFRTYSSFIYKEIHKQLLKHNIQSIDDVLLSNATSSYVVLTIVHKEIMHV